MVWHGHLWSQNNIVLDWGPSPLSEGDIWWLETPVTMMSPVAKNYIFEVQFESQK